MDPYIGEIRLFSGNYAPRDWVLCEGQTLQIQSYPALYSLLGITYGGDGRTTFGIPDLRGLLTCAVGKAPTSTNTYALAQTFGTAAVTLSEAQMPSHSHQVSASSQAGDATAPGGKVFAAATSPPGASYTLYDNATGTGISQRNLSSTALTSAGQSQPHSNLMPTLAVSYIMSLTGIFPMSE